MHPTPDAGVGRARLLGRSPPLLLPVPPFLAHLMLLLPWALTSFSTTFWTPGTCCLPHRGRGNSRHRGGRLGITCTCILTACPAASLPSRPQSSIKTVQICHCGPHSNCHACEGVGHWGGHHYSGLTGNEHTHGDCAHPLTFDRHKLPLQHHQLERTCAPPPCCPVNCKRCMCSTATCWEGGMAEPFCV